jgi:hypothetical protein
MLHADNIRRARDKRIKTLGLLSNSRFVHLFIKPRRFTWWQSYYFLNLQLQRQRCGRLECFFIGEKIINVLKTRYAIGCNS